jgi:hypothetical protein
VLSGDDAQIIALTQLAKPAPIVGKILGGMDEQPEGAPVVAKILGGMDEQPEDGPVVAKILGGFDDEQAPPRRAKRA